MIPLALSLAAILLVLAALHIYWAAGGRVGATAAIPEVAGKPAFTPGSNITLLVALALTLSALIVLGRARLWTPAGIPQSMFIAGTWGLTAVFLLRAVGDFRLVGFFKKVRGTHFAKWDTAFHSPLCLLLAAGWLALALR